MARGGVLERARNLVKGGGRTKIEKALAPHTPQVGDNVWRIRA
jgi:hypothetical protein